MRLQRALGTLGNQPRMRAITAAGGAASIRPPTDEEITRIPANSTYTPVAAASSGSSSGNPVSTTSATPAVTPHEVTTSASR